MVVLSQQFQLYLNREIYAKVYTLNMFAKKVIITALSKKVGDIMIAPVRLSVFHTFSCDISSSFSFYFVHFISIQHCHTVLCRCAIRFYIFDFSQRGRISFQKLAISACHVNSSLFFTLCILLAHLTRRVK